MNVDHIGLGVKMIVPHLLEQHGSGNDFAGIAHQIFKQPKFARLKKDFRSVATDIAGQAVYLEITNRYLGFGFIRLFATRQNFNPASSSEKA